MRDLSGGSALLILARNVLMNELVPLLPEERRTDALLTARRMAITERAAETETTLEHELRVLYGAGTDTDKLLQRFPREQRIGAFENLPDREVRARAILWRLTVAQLRRSNPEFLAASGVD
jgi:hypothetical protein